MPIQRVARVQEVSERIERLRTDKTQEALFDPPKRRLRIIDSEKTVAGELTFVGNARVEEMAMCNLGHWHIVDTVEY